MSRGEITLRHVALAGNPNVGKSSLFNAMTGLHQHTGNWPGKTVAVARGEYSFCGAQYALTDLPGTYSLTGGSEEQGSICRRGQTAALWRSAMQRAWRGAWRWLCS